MLGMCFRKSKPNSLNQFGIQLLSNSASFHCILVFCVAVSQEISCLIRWFFRVLSLQSRRGILWAVGISKKSMADCSMVCLNFRWYLWKFLRRHFVFFRISINLGKISPGFNFLLLYVFVSQSGVFGIQRGLQPWNAGLWGIFEIWETP